MKSKARFVIQGSLVVLFILVASLTLLSRSAMAQVPLVPPGVTADPSDVTKGFDAQTGENFFWDKDAHVWKNAKTGKAVGSYPRSTQPTGAIRPAPLTISSGGCSRVDIHVPEDTAKLKPKPLPIREEKKEVCDIEFGYDYMRAPDESAKSLNGFGGSLFCNVKSSISIGGDFGALFGSTTDTVGTTKIDVSLHRQTYLFGPQFNFYPSDKV